jgi:hypothetical protein
VNKHDICLLLTHQGTDWLTEAYEKHGETEIAPAGRFAVHLFGHMHEPKIENLSKGGGNAIRRHQGCSVFGMEKYGEPPAISRRHGYAAGKIVFEGDTATLRLWPRIATSTNGPWRFIPDHEHIVLPADEATKPEAIPLRRTAPPRQPPALQQPLPPPLPRPQSTYLQSDFISIPKSPWPEDLSAKGIKMPDSMLLRPEVEVVDFHKSREPLRDTIIGWALNPDQPIKLRLQAGDGGSGKTRLLIEVCKQLENFFSWRAGFAKEALFNDIAYSSLIKEGKPCLIVFDYAETRYREIIKLVRATLATTDRQNIRLVLLAREGGDWWDHLADSAGNDQSVAAVLRSTETKAGPFRMTRERIEKEDRNTAFDQALHDFVKFKGVLVPRYSPPDLSDELFGNPFFIHLAALATLRQQPSVNDNELIAGALGHERWYWRQLLEEGGISSDEMLR